MTSQIFIALFGVTAVALSQSAFAERRRWASVFGLLGQPFWFYAAWNAQQWGIFALCFLYTLSWGKGFYTNWIAPHSFVAAVLAKWGTPQPTPLSDDVVKDAARWRMVALIGNEVMLHPEKRTHAAAVEAYMDAIHSGSDLTAAVDAAIAAQGGAPQPAPPSDDVVKDAARYRWLRATTNYVTSNGERIDVRNMPEKWDAAIDAAIAAQGGK